MKKLYITVSLALLSILTFAQTPNISMTTTLSINSQITIGLRGNTSSTPIQIDWGNGIKENFTIGDTEEFFGYPVKGSNIKIWGAGITGLTIQSKNITALEFFDATLLESLFCKNNQITSLNLSGCSALEFVECNQNRISSLTLPNTTTLTYVDCSDNILTLATLPIKQATWTEYIYSPQKIYALPKTAYAVNEEIDLSSQLTSNGNTTIYIWKTTGGITLTKDIDFTEDNGKFTFIKAQGDKLYCQMTNANFPSLILTSENISVSVPLPLISVSTSNVISNTFWFKVKTSTNSTPIQVDWGNGILINYMINTSETNISGRKLGDTIKFYGLGVWYLDISSEKVTSLDVSNNTTLTHLNCSNNELTSLDVSNNTTLTHLNCSNNELTTLNVSKNTKLNTLICFSNNLSVLNLSMHTQLTNLDCHSNKISTLDVSKSTSLLKLNCSSNQLTTLDVTKNTTITNLNCSSNKIHEINISLNPLISSLDCSANEISSLDLSNNNNLIYFTCNFNHLDFTTLPLKKDTWLLYLYIPQEKIALSKKKYTLAETIDLSNHLVINGNTTQFIWKTIIPTTLEQGIDYGANNGIFTFLAPLHDSVFCQMTNASFPGLNIITTRALITEFPTSIDKTKMRISIYPNPFNESLTIEIAENISKVEVYTIIGVKIYEMIGKNTNTITIPANDFPRGILIVKVYGKYGVIEKKVLKK